MGRKFVPKKHNRAHIKLGVAATTAAAIRGYERFGFETYGKESCAIFCEGKYYDG